MIVVFYISGHGLGHASRATELIDRLTSQGENNLRVVVRTSAPAWAFLRVQKPSVEVQRCDTDPGVAQVDSLTIDEDETMRRAAAFYREFERRAKDEATHLQQLGATLVVSDIPPIAFAAAHLAGIPSVAVANFTWEWIYAYYARFERTAPGVIDTMARAYEHATLALRLPFPGGFQSMAAVTRDIPFIARRSARAPADTRRVLGLDSRQLIVLSSFTGHGLALPYQRLAASGLAVLAPEQVPTAGLRYEDLVAAADVVVSKPGYGIVSDCVANGTPLLYTSRGRFAEYDVMVGEMPRLLRCRFIAGKDVVSGNWMDGIQALCAQPEVPERPRVDGAAIAADAILTLGRASIPFCR